MRTIVIQAGGESRRMGVNKALLPFLGQPLVERVVNRVQGVAAEVFITTNSAAEFEFLALPLIPDVFSGRGALGGLYTAIFTARYPSVGVIACDMPFVNRYLLEAQFSLLESGDYDVIIPDTPVGMEPFHAVYRKETCLPAIQKAIETDQRRMISWFSEVKVYKMQVEEIIQYDPNLQGFININTPEELHQAEKLAASQAK